jgi:hypothetical protein
MLGQKDKSISISYTDYDDPKLFGKLCQAHIQVLDAFDLIGLYNGWVNKIDDIFGTSWSKNNVLEKQSSSFIYRSFFIELQKIIESNSTVIK